MDRFDLEQAIYDADMTTDLSTAFERHCDGGVMGQDDVDNMLMGLWQVSQLRHWKLQDTFKRAYGLDEYCTDPEVLALRERLEKSRLKENVE